MAQQSRYLKPQRELKIFQAVAVLFFLHYMYCRSISDCRFLCST